MIIVTIVLEPCYNGFRQTAFFNNQKKSTNSLKRIEDVISRLPNNPQLIKFVGDEVRFIYEGNHRVILKKYSKHKDRVLYKQVFATVENDPTVVRIRNKNNSKLSKLAVSSFLLITLTGTALSLHNLAKTDSYSTISPSYSIGREDVLANHDNNLIIENDDDLTIENDDVVVDNSNYDLVSRLEQSNKIFKGEISNNSTITIGNNLTESNLTSIVNFINSEVGQYCFNTCEDFGIDPYLFISLMMQESHLNHSATIPGGNFYNGNGVGICQLENPHGENITAFNYATGEEETLVNTMDAACNEQNNIKMGIMRFQNVLEKYKGNVYLALQSYNYGRGLVDSIICIYADEIGSTYDNVVANLNDFGWMKYVKMTHNNPQSFAKMIDTNKYPEFQITADYLNKWSYDTYGDENYVSNVLSYYIGTYGKNQINDKIIETNYLTNEVVKTPVTEVENTYKF